MAPWRDQIIEKAKKWRPSFLSKKPHFDFITAHCTQSSP